MDAVLCSKCEEYVDRSELVSWDQDVMCVWCAENGGMPPGHIE